MFGISYLRLGIYFVVACIMGYLIYQYRTGQEAKAQVAVVTKQRDDAIAGHDAYVATRAKQDAITTKASTDYENAVTDLRDQLIAARDANSHVRLCHSSVPQSSPTSTAASGPDAASKDGPATEAEQVVSTGELYQIAGEAVECGERLNHLQDWVKQQLAVSTTQ